MLILLGVTGVLFLLAGVAVARSVRASGDKSLGWMSEQWLSEHRSSGGS